MALGTVPFIPSPAAGSQACAGSNAQDSSALGCTPGISATLSKLRAHDCSPYPALGPQGSPYAPWPTQVALIQNQARKQQPAQKWKSRLQSLPGPNSASLTSSLSSSPSSSSLSSSSSPFSSSSSRTRVCGSGHVCPSHSCLQAGEPGQCVAGAAQPAAFCLHHLPGCVLPPPSAMWLEASWWALITGWNEGTYLACPWASFHFSGLFTSPSILHPCCTWQFHTHLLF